MKELYEDTLEFGEIKVQCVCSISFIYKFYDNFLKDNEAKSLN